MIRLSEVAEEGVKLPFHPIVFGIGMFSLLAIAIPMTFCGHNDRIDLNLSDKMTIK